MFTSRLARGHAAVLLLAWISAAETVRADNPVVQHVYTADPAPMVHGDTVYLCTSHDEDVTVGDFFTMNDWRVFSSKDMVNWTDHGSPLSYRTFSWATGKAWAPHCVERNGKFYFFVPVSDAIGVAVADSPTGPFVDAIGAPLLSNYQYIDPTVFIDGDGQAYLYFGNPKLWYVKLDDDMTSVSGPVEEVPMTAESFGQRSGDPNRPTLYEEGPWFYERNGLYHMLFAAGPLPERIAYASSPGPTGPWTYGRVVMNNESGHAFTNHAGVIDFKGRSYFFYHTQELAGGGGYKRSVAIEEFAYEPDGSFPTIVKTAEGVTESVTPLDPYVRVEGETIAWASGIEVEDCSEGGRDVGNIENGDFIKLRSVEFLTGAVSFSARVASGASGGEIELRLDSADGTLLGTCSVPGTGGWQIWETVSCDVAEVSGVHDLYLSFKGGAGSLFNLDSWQFTPKDPRTGSGGAGGTAGAGGLGAGGLAGTSGGGTTGGTPSSGGGAGISGTGGSGAASGSGAGGTSSGAAGSASGSGGAGGVQAGAAGVGGFGGEANTPLGGAQASGGSAPTAPADSGCACAMPRGGSRPLLGAAGAFGVLAVFAWRRRYARRR
jgi:arabinoxylan arabinofuranohydrolase